MIRRPIAAAVALFALVLAPAVLAAEYTIDARHSQVLFTYLHMGFSHITGRFTEPSGRFDFDPAAPAKSSIEVDLPMSSLSTGFPGLDNDLSGDGFFNVAQFPTAHFKSTKVVENGKNRLAVSGDLTIHGVTKPVVLDVTINQIGIHPMKKIPAVGFDATTTIKRSDFGVTKLIPIGSDDVVLRITLEAQEAKAK